MEAGGDPSLFVKFGGLFDFVPGSVEEVWGNCAISETVSDEM